MKFDFGKMLFLTIFLSVFGLGFITWPIFIFGLVFSVLTGNKKKSTPKANNRKTVNDKSAKYVPVMKSYFSTHQSLMLDGGLSIKIQNGHFVSVNDLMLYLGDDQIGTMDEFRKTYPSTYDDLLQQCALVIESGKAEEKTVHQTKADEKLSTIGQFIEVLNGQNLEIEHEQITQGLYEVCAYLKQIDLIIKQFPESADKTKKLTQYYLPILVDILESYKQLNKSARNHEEFKKTEDRLLKTILLINEALKTITTSLTQEHFMDLSADMKTLETLLKKDGLVSTGTLSELRKQVKVHE